MRKLSIVGTVALALIGLGLPARAQHFTFHGYGQPDGLKNLSTRRILQDSSGFLWVGTEDGLFRFDGSTFEKMPLATPDEPFITALALDAAGRVWAATNHALLYFDETGPHPVSPAGEPLEFDLQASLSADPDDPDRLYLVSHQQLLVARRDAGNHWQIAPYFDASRLSMQPDLQKISFVYTLPHHQLWLGCGAGLCSVTGAAVRLFGKGAGLPEESWRMAFVDHLQRLWVRGEHHLVRLDPGARQFASASDGIPGSSMSVRNQAVVEDHEGRILINLNEGIARFEGSSWQILSEKTELPSYAVTTLYIDRQNSAWLGLDGHGVARWLGYDEVQSWTVANGLSTNVIWNFARDRRGRMWIATEKNLERMVPDPKNPALSRIEPEFGGESGPMRRVQSLALTRDGHLWTGSDDGSVLDYDPETKRTRKVTNTPGVFHILPDRSGRIWICSMNGLSYVDTASLASGAQRITTSAGPQGRVYEGVQDRDGALWFISDSGLFRFLSNTWTRIQLPADYRPVLSAQIALAADGTLWLSGIEPVLMHLSIHGDKAEALDIISSTNLGSNNVYFVKIDRRGWLWVGTGDGVNVSNGQRWTHFASEDGLVWNDLDSNAYYEDDDGTIWIGTSGGISQLLHPERLFVSTPLSLSLTEVKIGATLLNPQSETEVHWGHQPLTARLSSLDFKRQPNISFRYRIEGLGEDWQDTVKHELRYPPLPPGRYRLAVLALETYEGRRSAPIYVAFTVLPPWWRTNAVFAAEGLLVLLLCLLLWRWSVRVLVARQHHLEALVKQRTRDLEIEKAELLKTRAALEQQATHDSLTGLFNRGAILGRLEHELERANREGNSLAILLLDIDHFKHVNDTWGHVTGDCVLQEYAQRLKAIARPYDEVGRYGGEELLMILPGFAELDSESRLEAMHFALCEKLFNCNGQQLRVTCSLGAAWYLPGQDSIRSLIERADQALYAAKANGRNGVEVG